MGSTHIEKSACIYFDRSCQSDPRRTQIVDGHISMAVLCYTGQPFCHPRDTLRKHIDILTSSKGFKAILPRSFSLVNSFRPFLLKKFCRSWLPDSGRKIARHSTCNLQSLCVRRGFFLFLHHNPTPHRTGHCRQCGTDRPALLPPGRWSRQYTA